MHGRRADQAGLLEGLAWTELSFGVVDTTIMLSYMVFLEHELATTTAALLFLTILLRGPRAGLKDRGWIHILDAKLMHGSVVTCAHLGLANIVVIQVRVLLKGEVDWHAMTGAHSALMVDGLHIVSLNHARRY